MRRGLLIAVLAAALVACGQPADQPGGDTISDPASSVAIEPDDGLEPNFDVEPVNPALLAAPSAAFAAIEPSEVGVFPAPSVLEALEPLIPPEAFEEDAAISVSLREEGETVWADVVRENIPDDSVAAGHIRIEFRREPEGWFPTNAYRRWMCRRGDVANQWSSALCP
ncbi:MAG TPA: hypothetical protein PKY87_11570 [Terricaulis sp.]|nr:hypothetical protein [Terricaulis sp.]